MISVCMATYNGANYLEQQLRSITSQLQPGDELIISDDGSTDKTLDILNFFEGDNVRIFKNNFRNPVLNFQFALEQSTQPLICFSDQDDIWLENKRQLIYDHLHKARKKLIMMNADIIDANDEPTEQTTYEKWESRPGFWNNLTRNTFMGSSMAFTADLKPYILPFPPSVAMHDWWIGLLAGKVGKVVWLKEKTLQYRIHGNNASLRGSTAFQKIQWRINMMRAIRKRINATKAL